MAVEPVYVEVVMPAPPGVVYDVDMEVGPWKGRVVIDDLGRTVGCVAEVTRVWPTAVKLRIEVDAADMLANAMLAAVLESGSPDDLP